MTVDLDHLKIKVRDLVKTVYEGDAYALSSINEKGPFDVLPLHANFISLVREKIIIHQKDGKNTELKIDTGILKIHNNIVNVFLGIEAT